MLDPILNFAKATLTAGVASGVTTIVASSGEGAEFPDPALDGAFNLVFWNASDYGDPADDPFREIVRCTVRVTDTFTITRAQEGTSDNNHNISGKEYKIALPFTKKTYEEIAIQYNSISISSDYTAASFGIILTDTSGGDVTVTLPDPTSIPDRIYTVKKKDSSANYVIVDGDGATIDGSATISTKKQTAFKLVNDGTNYFII